MILGAGKSKVQGQTGRLEVEVRVDFAVLSPNSARQQDGNAGRVSTVQS